MLITITILITCKIKLNRFDDLLKTYNAYHSNMFDQHNHLNNIVNLNHFNVLIKLISLFI